LFYLRYFIYDCCFYVSVSAYAAFKNNITVVTIYTNLGIDGIIHAVNETQASALLCSYETWSKVKEFIPHCPDVKKILVMENQVGTFLKKAFRDLKKQTDGVMEVSQWRPTLPKHQKLLHE